MKEDTKISFLYCQAPTLILNNSTFSFSFLFLFFVFHIYLTICCFNISSVLFSFLPEYVPRKSCRTECSLSSPCKPGFVCESVGCNRLCRGNKGVLPVEPLWPINPPINPINTRCVTQCQRSSDCINGRCVRQGCNRVCENRLIDQVLPINPVIPGLPGLGCRDECRRSIECGVGAVCIRRGCRRVCERGTIPTCLDQCTSSMDCQFNQVCARQGCRNICIRKPIINKY